MKVIRIYEYLMKAGEHNGRNNNDEDDISQINNKNMDNPTNDCIVKMQRLIAKTA